MLLAICQLHHLLSHYDPVGTKEDFDYFGGAVVGSNEQGPIVATAFRLVNVKSIVQEILRERENFFLSVESP